MLRFRCVENGLTTLLLQNKFVFSICQTIWFILKQIGRWCWYICSVTSLTVAKRSRPFTIWGRTLISSTIVSAIRSVRYRDAPQSLARNGCLKTTWSNSIQPINPTGANIRSAVLTLSCVVRTTLWTIKRWQYISNGNSGKSWWILITFTYLKTGINTLCK